METAFEIDAGDGNRLLQWRTGSTASGSRPPKGGKKKLLWIINGGPGRTVTVTDRAGKFRGASGGRELVGGKDVPFEPAPGGGKRCTLDVPAGEFALLCW